MSGIEDLVRRSMREQVTRPPAMQDPAGRALRGAGAARRSRTVLNACAGVVVLVLGVAGFVVLRDSRAQHPPLPSTTATTASTGSPAPTSAAAGVAVIVDRRELLLPDGRRVPLGQIDGSAHGAYQTRDGWLVGGYRYSGEPEAASLWLVTPDRSLHRLVEKSWAPVAIAPDGRRFAWRAGDWLNVGHLTGDTVKVDFSVPARTERAHPVAFTGTAVVLGYSETGGGIGHWDVWLPDRGVYVPSEESMTHVITVYPPAPDGSLVGLVHDPRAPQGSKSFCLAQLDPADNLRATGPACGLLRIIDPLATVSPDGRWLAVQSASDTGRGQVALIDLNSVFQRPAVTVTWDAQGPGVWVDATTMIAEHRDGGLRRFHIGGSAPEPVTVPGLPSGVPYSLVPRLP